MKILPTLSLISIDLLTACQNHEKDETAPPAPSPNAEFQALIFADVGEDGTVFVPPANLALEVTLARLGA